MKEPSDLPLIQKTYDLIRWYVPILNRLPRDYKFTLADRMITNLYDILDGLIKAQFTKDKIALLESINSQLDILRYQTRLLYDFNLIHLERYEYVSQLISTIDYLLGI